MKNKIVLLETIIIWLGSFLVYALTTHFFRSKGLEPQSWEYVFLFDFNYMLLTFITLFIVIYIRQYLENYKEE